MGNILEVLLAGRTLDEVLHDGAKNIKLIGAESQVRVFRVTQDTGLVTTELYPNSKPITGLNPKAKQA